VAVAVAMAVFLMGVDEVFLGVCMVRMAMAMAMAMATAMAMVQYLN